MNPLLAAAGKALVYWTAMAALVSTTSWLFLNAPWVFLAVMCAAAFVLTALWFYTHGRTGP